MARYSQDDEEGKGLGDYMGSFFGGSGGGGGVTDPPARAADPGMQIIPSTTVNPETGFAWNSKEDLAALNKLYGSAQGGQSAESWITQHESGRDASEGVNPLLSGLQAGGYKAAPYMYGSTPSGNEILLNGVKTKLISENGGGTPTWYTGGDDSAPGGLGGGGGQQGGYGQPGGTGFADPAYQQLNDLVQKRLGALNQPQSFPQLDAYMSMLQQQQAQARQRAQAFADQLTGRISQLQKPLLTDADVANQHALASNNLLKQRDAELRNRKEAIYARGFEPSSGLAEGTDRSINEAYTGAQSNIDAQLQSMSIKQDEQRRNQATQLQGLVAQALSGGDVAALQSAASMADLENQQFNIDQNRQREQLTTANIPVDLTNMGFANALNASNSNQNPLGAIFSLIGAGQNQQGLQQSQTNSNMSALAWLLQTVLK